MNRDNILSKNYIKSFMTILYICLAFMFITFMVDPSGQLNLIIFIADIIFVVGMTKKIKNVLYFFAALMPNFALLSGSISAISINRIIFVFVVGYFLFSIKKTRKLRNAPVPLLFYIVWFAYIVINTFVIGRGAIIGLLPISVFFIISVDLECDVIGNKRNSEKFLSSIIVGFSFIIIIALVELLIGHTFFYSSWTGGERYRNGILRMGSTVSDPNNLCFALIPFLFLLEISSVRKLISKHFRRFIEVTGVIVVLCSSSRTGLVAIIVGATFLLLAKRKTHLFLALPVIGLASNYLLSLLETLRLQDSASTNFRKYMLEKGMLIWRENIWLGAGGSQFNETLQAVDSLGIISNSANTMNTYIYTLICYGLIGLSLFILFWIFLLKKDVISWFTAKNTSKDTVLRLSATLVLLIMAYSLDTFYMVSMWILPAVFIATNQSGVMESS